MILAALGLALAASGSGAATFLFDATKAEMAGNADWVIDADLHNIRISSGVYGSGVTNIGGNESNPQRFPTPDASGITSSTPENYWQGALSAWAVDLVKNGHAVETLPYNSHITYGDATNPQDLTNYQVFVLCEPNIAFTAAERDAIVSFVWNGGGLFMVSDHVVADRNNDGTDAFANLNGIATNSIQENPFGIRFNGDNISPSSDNVDPNPGDPLIQGAAGAVANIAYHNGSSISIDTNQNPSAQIAVWTTATHDPGNGLAAYATFGSGKVVAVGDSSLCDDGTGDPNDINLFVDYPDTSTGDGKLILNASLWLAPPPVPALRIEPLASGIQISWPAAATNYVLQTTADLLQTNSWTVVTNAPQVVSASFVVTNLVGAGPDFYRLLRTP